AVDFRQKQRVRACMMQVGGRLDTSAPAATTDATSTHRHGHTHLHHSMQRAAALSQQPNVPLQKPSLDSTATTSPSVSDAAIADVAPLSDVVSDVSDSDSEMDAQQNAQPDRDDNILATNEIRSTSQRRKGVDDDNRDYEAVDDNGGANNDTDDEGDDSGSDKDHRDANIHSRRRGRSCPIRRVSMSGNVVGRGGDAPSGDSHIIDIKTKPGFLNSAGGEALAAVSSNKRVLLVNDAPVVDSSKENTNINNNTTTTTVNNNSGINSKRPSDDDDSTEDDDDLDEELDSEEGSDDNSDDEIDEDNEIKYSEIGPEDEILPTDDSETVSIKRIVREAKLETGQLKKAIEETAKQLSIETKKKITNTYTLYICIYRELYLTNVDFSVSNPPN
ncbi:hypothetical protein HDU82_002123, partial [Entophlyctis luteolus]